MTKKSRLFGKAWRRLALSCLKAKLTKTWSLAKHRDTKFVVTLATSAAAFGLGLYNFIVALPRAEFQVVLTDLRATFEADPLIARFEIELSAINSGNVPLLIFDGLLAVQENCFRIEDQTGWLQESEGRQSRPASAILVKPGDMARSRFHFEPVQLDRTKDNHLCLSLTFVDKKQEQTELRIIGGIIEAGESKKGGFKYLAYKRNLKVYDYPKDLRFQHVMMLGQESIFRKSVQ